MMDDGRLAELAESIRTHGLQVPILLWEDQILDGRNRSRACEIAGIEPRFVQWSGGNPFEHVWALNAQRRDLEPGQRAAIRLRVQKASGEWQAEQEQRKAEANAARAEATREQVKLQPRGDDGRVRGNLTPIKTLDGEDFHFPTADLDFEPGDLQPCKRPGAEKPTTIHAHVALATAAQVSPRTAASVQSLANKRPDLLDAVADGTMGLTEATRQAKREDVARKIEALPSTTYRVLYADPPWRYGDSRAGLQGYDSTSAEHHYPTMSVADICALGVRPLADPDAVLFLWATFPLLPDALEVVKAWGFKYKTALVWSKKRPNFGHYHTADAELLLICTRGSCMPDADKRERQVQEVERTGRHSEKPECFRELIDRQYTNGRRLELFRRGEAPDGWDVWGNEADNATTT